MLARYISASLCLLVLICHHAGIRAESVSLGADGEVEAMAAGGVVTPSPTTWHLHFATRGQDQAVSVMDAMEQEPELDKAVEMVCCAMDEQYRALDRLWVRADYLYWWMEAYGVPPLATTVPVDGGPGTITNPNATIALGNGRLDTDGRSGVRTEIGYLLFPSHMVSIQADFFVLEQGGSSTSLAATDDTSPYRPYFDTYTNVQNAEQADTIDVSSTSQVASAGVALRKQICCCYDPCCYQKGDDKSGYQTCCYPRGYTIDLLGGYRYFGVDESLTMHETASYPPGEPSTFFDLTDRFETKNQFHGGELGIVAQCYRGPWALESVLKVALGNNHEQVIISGQSITTTVPPTTTEIRDGALFANPSNIGRYTENHFAAIPQFELRLRRQVTQRLSLSLGYTFLYISDLVRPGDQIDFAVDGRWLDPNFVPPGTPPAEHPEPKFERSDAWLQGMDVGLTWNY